MFLPPALHLDWTGHPVRFPQDVASRQPDHHGLNTKAGFINSMEYIHPWFENTTEEEIKALFDEIRESLPEIDMDEIVRDED